MSSRLATVAPELVPCLESRPEGELRNIVAVVAREAVARSGLNDPVVASALDQIENDEPASVTLDVQEVVARLDEVAWDIQESDEGHENERYLVAFKRARAAAAVAFALDPNMSAALESIYEAQASLGSIDAVRRLIESLLSSA